MLARVLGMRRSWSTATSSPCERVQTAADELLALRAGVPRAGALRLLGDGEQEATDAREALAHPLLAGVSSPLELASR
ncbi:hypothetical protein GCM10009858_35100 [Terrabacter carboxydivorans]|uniref:Uncharacterized protein n=1 Tax=Terrabacter carboxydivorans TaxID=619730 RepID=A0ABN3M1I4_9MICO